MSMFKPSSGSPRTLIPSAASGFELSLVEKDSILDVPNAPLLSLNQTFIWYLPVSFGLRKPYSAICM